jgi:hypothetical protein
MHRLGRAPVNPLVVAQNSRGWPLAVRLSP